MDTPTALHLELLLQQYAHQLKDKAISLYKSGAIDTGKYDSRLLARILLAAAAEALTPSLITFPTKEVLEELENLKHF